MYIDEAQQFHDAALPAHNPDPSHSKTYDFALFLCFLHTCGDCKNHTLFDNNVFTNSFSFTWSFLVFMVLMKAFSSRRW